MDPQNTEPQKTPIVNSTPVNPQPAVAAQTPLTTPVKKPENVAAGTAKVEEEEPTEAVPIYKEWTFWMLVGLVLVLIVISYVYISSLLIPPISANLEIQGETIRVHVSKLTAPSEGFLVVQKEQSGFPGGLIDVSPPILPATYRDVYIPFNYDETSNFAYYSNLVATSKIFVTFYKDKDGNHVYDQATDTEVAKDVLGRRMQISIVKNQ